MRRNIKKSYFRSPTFIIIHTPWLLIHSLFSFILCLMLLRSLFCLLDRDRLFAQPERLGGWKDPGEVAPHGAADVAADTAFCNVPAREFGLQRGGGSPRQRVYKQEQEIDNNFQYAYWPSIRKSKLLISQRYINTYASRRQQRRRSTPSSAAAGALNPDPTGTVCAVLPQSTWFGIRRIGQSGVWAWRTSGGSVTSSRVCWSQHTVAGHVPRVHHSRTPRCRSPNCTCGACARCTAGARPRRTPRDCRTKQRRSFFCILEFQGSIEQLLVHLIHVVYMVNRL